MTDRRFLSVAIIFAAIVVLCVWSALTTHSTQIDDVDAAYGPPQFAFEKTVFTALKGWDDDDHAAALPVFLRSCDRLTARPMTASANSIEALGDAAQTPSFSGRIQDWAPACEGAAALVNEFSDQQDGYKKAVKDFFETAFVPYSIKALRAPLPDGPAQRMPPLAAPMGRYTGYFETVYKGARQKTAPYTAPVYARPDDLVMVDLGRFREDLAGRRIAGSVKNGRLVPYPDHAAINAGALEDGRGEILAWMEPTDLLFMQIQGSGRLEFDDSAPLRLGYAGQNGHPYTAVGRVLIDMGAAPRKGMSMQVIRDWLAGADPADARGVREANASYVFFRELTDLKDPALGPFGAGGVQLTPGRSLAIDRRFHALGAPIWVSIAADDQEEGRALDWRRLMIAQDTGGAIRGPVRGDIYTGTGQKAGALAGGLNAMGTLTVLLPRAAADRLEKSLSHDPGGQQ